MLEVILIHLPNFLIILVPRQGLNIATKNRKNTPVKPRSPNKYTIKSPPEKKLEL